MIQYRLFVHEHARSKLIVFTWVNDEDTKRAYVRSDDAHRIFCVAAAAPKLSR